MKLRNFSLAIASAAVFAALFGCASSQPAPDNSDEIRARAASAYSEIDYDDEEMPSAPSSKKSAPKASPKKTTVAKLSGSMYKQLDSYACPNEDDLRGFGMGQTSALALTDARQNIAGQIQASLEGMTVKGTKQSMDIDGNEEIKHSFTSEARMLVKLKNANDAKSVAVVEGDGNFGVLACMSRADAAKPYLGKFDLMKDSLTFAVEYFEQNQHPKNKYSIYKKALETYGRYLAVENILTSLDYPVGTEARDAFEELQHLYLEYTKRYAFYFSVEDSDDSDLFQTVLFERISKEYNVSDEECSDGLKLKASISSVKCTDGSFGRNCSVDVFLSGSSCQGDSYFKVHSTVKATARDDETAKTRLVKNMATDKWFDEWKKELNKWKLN